jgi:hypothetical protein
MSTTMSDISTTTAKGTTRAAFEPIWIGSEATSAITCQPWCEDGEGHAGEQNAEDQWCHGTEHRLPLRLEGTSSGGGLEPEYVTVYPQKTFGVEPSVFFGVGWSGRGWKMTPDEALRFARELVLAAEQIKAAAA